MFSRLFAAMCAAIALNLCTWFHIYDLQIKFKNCCYRPIFGKCMPLKLSHFKGFYSVVHFFLCLQIFISCLIHCFAIPGYRSSLSLVLIHWFSSKLWPLDLEKYHDFSVFRTFFSLPTDIHLIFGTLLYHTKLQIKFKFGFDPLICHEISQIMFSNNR
jgi:hypothetical protein